MKVKKIVIVGTSASGKSTFARKLAKQLSLPLIHIDSLMWSSGWEYAGDETAIERIRTEAEKSEWIIEGFMFEAVVAELLEKADQIIYLDYARWILVWRYLKRTWQHRADPRPEIPGCLDSFSLGFMWRILMKKEVYWLERELKEGAFDATLVRLERPTDANKFLQHHELYIH